MKSIQARRASCKLYLFTAPNVRDAHYVRFECRESSLQPPNTPNLCDDSIRPLSERTKIAVEEPSDVERALRSKLNHEERRTAIPFHRFSARRGVYAGQTHVEPRPHGLNGSRAPFLRRGLRVDADAPGVEPCIETFYPVIAEGGERLHPVRIRAFQIDPFLLRQILIRFDQDDLRSP